VNYQSLVHARIACRNDKWLPVYTEADVTNKTFVQNLIDLVAVKTATFWQPFERGASGLGDFLHELRPRIRVLGEDS
jgi:hypothetical protein